MAEKGRLHHSGGQAHASWGTSGAGTVHGADLIAKYYQPRRPVTIGGQDIRDIPAEQVCWSVSAWWTQEKVIPVQAHGGGQHPLRSAPAPRSGWVEEPAVLANANGFLGTMEQGYETEIGENGNRLSGGERHGSAWPGHFEDSPSLCLDEATASLDIENDCW